MHELTCNFLFSIVVLLEQIPPLVVVPNENMQAANDPEIFEEPVVNLSDVSVQQIEVVENETATNENDEVIEVSDPEVFIVHHPDIVDPGIHDEQPIEEQPGNSEQDCVEQSNSFQLKIV